MTKSDCGTRQQAEAARETGREGVKALDVHVGTALHTPNKQGSC
jgi:hypothetical protein